MDSSLFFGIASIAYILAMITYIAYLAFRKPTIGIVATSLTVAGFAAHTAAFFIRWKEFYEIGKMGILRAIPLTNLYESLIFFVWCLILGYLVIEWKYRTRSFGAFVTPVAGMALAFIDISGMDKNIHPLIPALQSNWLLAHVTMSFLAYATFAISFSTALMYLAVTSEDRKSAGYIFWTVTLGLFISVLVAMGVDYVTFKIVGHSADSLVKSHLLKASFRSSSILVVALSYAALAGLCFLMWRYGYLLSRLISSFALSKETLDELTYKSIAVGFPVFTLG